MDHAICKSCQTLRRTGKRFVFSNVSRSNINRDVVKNLKANSSKWEILRPRYSTAAHDVRHFSPMQRGICSNNTLENYHFPNVNSTQYFARASIIFRRIHSVAGKSFVTHSEIEDTLHASETSYKKGHAGYLTTCKPCLNGGLTSDEDLSLFIDQRTGESICRSCGVRYDWGTFKATINASDMKGKNTTLNPIAFEYNDQKPVEHERWVDSQPVTQSSKEDLDSFFQLHNISVRALNNFHVRSSSECRALVFPYYDITKKQVIGFKVCHTAQPLIVKEQDHLSPFGWHLINYMDRQVILTTSELDSIAVSVATGVPSLALPYGASRLPPDILPYLEQFEEIILWFGEEYRAKENLQQFASKLGLSRCSHVLSNNGALVVLNHIGKQEVTQLVQKRWRMSHDHIVSFKEIRNELLNVLINVKENAGVPFTRFPILNDYLKGHRRGELTIFTGPTGSGKTTFLSELSLDLCTQGVKTLWGSFEIKNVRLANIMMHQYSGIALANHISKFPHWSEEFEKLPMYFMSYYGAQNLKKVLETIEYAIYTYDIEHIVIDNLQFMVDINTGDDRFQVMDGAISSFRKCASKHNVHVTLVIHPRKENDGNMLQTSSIYGSAKASQEADNVLILQSLDGTSMQVSKNRFSGTIGTIPLCFNPSSLCLSGFHRVVETGESILPALKAPRIIRNLKVIKKSTKGL